MSVCTRIFLCLTMCVGAPIATYAQRLPGSALILETDTVDRPWFSALPSSFRAVAEVANRQIAVNVRIPTGESASGIPARTESLSKPIFDGRELQQWKVSENRLPPNNEVRVQEHALWEEHPALMITILFVLLAQAAVIAAFAFEHRRRRLAEKQAQRSMSELANIDTSIATNSISASIAHELNQPLGAILSNVEAAEALIQTQNPDMNLLKEILVDIHEADQRAGEIIKRLRGLLRQGDLNATIADLDEAIRDVMHILEADAARRHIVLQFERECSKLMVCANTVQIRQILINLLFNAMEAIDAASNARASSTAARVVGIAIRVPSRSIAEILVSDTGSGIPDDKLDVIFKSFFTTKPQGTGLGLSIVRSIVESLHGAIWAENRTTGGAVFHFTLPLAQSSNVI